MDPSICKRERIRSCPDGNSTKKNQYFLQTVAVGAGCMLPRFEGSKVHKARRSYSMQAACCHNCRRFGTQRLGKGVTDTEEENLTRMGHKPTAIVKYYYLHK